MLKEKIEKILKDVYPNAFIKIREHESGDISLRVSDESFSGLPSVLWDTVYGLLSDNLSYDEIKLIKFPIFHSLCEVMDFEVGKCYKKHTPDGDISYFKVVGDTLDGYIVIAVQYEYKEELGYPSFLYHTIVDEDMMSNYSEITEEDWEEHSQNAKAYFNGCLEKLEACDGQ